MSSAPAETSGTQDIPAQVEDVGSSEESGADDHSEDSLDRWTRLVNGPTKDRGKANDARNMDQNQQDQGHDLKPELDNTQASRREGKKPATELQEEPEQDVRRRRRRRNQPAWYDADQDDAQQKQLAPGRPQGQQQLQPLNLQQQQQQLEFERQQMQMQQPKRNNSLKLRLDLNLDVEVTLKAKIRGDITLALLFFTLKSPRN